MYWNLLQHCTSLWLFFRQIPIGTQIVIKFCTNWADWTAFLYSFMTWCPIGASTFLRVYSGNILRTYRSSAVSSGICTVKEIENYNTSTRTNITKFWTTPDAEDKNCRLLNHTKGRRQTSLIAEGLKFKWRFRQSWQQFRK